MTAIGFFIYDVNGSELVQQGNANYGLTSTGQELYAILEVLSLIVVQGWKYLGVYIHLKSDLAFAVWSLTHKKKEKAEGLAELVETSSFAIWC